MPKETVYISELEAEILSLFVKRGQFNDLNIAHDLEILVEKLKK